MTSIEASKNLKQKNRIVIIIALFALFGLTCVLLIIMKSSYPFNIKQNYVIPEVVNSEISQIKTITNEKSILIAVLTLIILITIKLKSHLNFSGSK